MKYPCEIIEDLLPLYEEELCSAASRRAVEEHLTACPICRQMAKTAGPEEVPEPPAADRAVAKGLKRTRRKWLASVLAAVFLVPMLLLTGNQVRGVGISIANAEACLTGKRFVEALEAEHWETAATMVDFEGRYDEIMQMLARSPQEWIPTYTQVEFDGELWYLSDRLDAEYLKPTLAETVYAVACENGEQVLLPAQVVEELDEECISLRSNGLFFLEEFYTLQDTPWGVFYVAGGTMDCPEDWISIPLIPQAAYQAIQAELAREGQRSHAWIQNRYGGVAKLTREEYVRQMEQSYAAQLAELSTLEVELTGSVFHAVWKREGGWLVEFRTEATKPSWNPAAMEVKIQIEEGKITAVYPMSEDERYWVRDVWQLLSAERLP